jgi:hypothetical protein
MIQNPYAGASYVSTLLRSGDYFKVRVLASLADGWTFSAHPQNVTKVNYDGSSWKPIDITKVWQARGYSNYHGTAWYRRKFTLPPLTPNEQVQIYFDSIDGNAVIYLNGKKLRDHLLGPAPTYTGWNKPFVSDIPASWLTQDENVITVQVASKSLDTASGMTGGVAIIGKIPLSY